MKTTLDIQIADGIDKLLAALTKPKSRIDLCSIILIQDDLGREMEVYYRLEDLALNAQTDESRESYLIEQVKYCGKRVNLTTRGERNILEEINFINPDKI